jgi:hypothetical protein
MEWKDRRNVFILSGINSEEMQTVHNKKGGVKRKPKVCIDYDKMGGVDFSDISMARKRMKKYCQKIF